MNHHGTSERMGEALKRARHHWMREIVEEARHMSPLPEAPPRFTIALSREAGIDAMEFARRVGERLGWEVYDREIVEHIAHEEDVRAELLESLDEGTARRISTLAESSLQPTSVTAREYARCLLETLHSLASHGDCVIIGRGAAIVLPPETTLAVRLVAPLAERIQAVQSQQKLSERDAREYVEKVDAERREFVKSHFHRDTADLQHYDLVLNVSRLKPEHCVELIVTALELRTADAATLA